jgi:hypothetical protein
MSTACGLDLINKREDKIRLTIIAANVCFTDERC